MPSSLPRGPTGRAPNDVAVIGIRPIDAALLPKAGECRRQLSATDDCFPQNSPAARLELPRSRVRP